MKSYNSKLISVFLTWSVQVFTLQAYGKNCTPGVMVRRNTVYTVNLGEELRVKCPVEFCSSSPPAVYWSKKEGNQTWANVTINNHIKTEWITFKQNYGESYLIFQNFLKSDSGRYQCKSEGSVSHTIIINVAGTTEPTTTSCETTSESPAAQSGSWHFVYRGLGVMVFFIIVISICIKSNIQCKGKSRNTPELCAEPSNHIYENDL